MADETQRTYFERRKQALITDRSSFLPQWRELSQNVQPRLGRYFITDTNRGDKRHQLIINSQATQSHRSARAGLFAGTMSPSRPWMNMMTPDPDMMAYQPVQEWLYKVEQLMFAIFASSNLYNMAPVMLGELILFGTGCISQVDDFDNVTRFYTHTIGSYMLAQNDKFQVDTMVREMQMTVRQVVAKAKASGGGVSKTVQAMYDRGQYESWVPLVHFVEPNSDANPGKPQSKFKKFRSTYYEPQSPITDAPLSDKGFDEFPVHCPRWDVTGEDTYATDCPGMTTLGDVKGLQALEKMKAKAIAKMVDPPMEGPPSLRNVAVNSMPNGVTIYDGSGNNQRLQPLYSVNPQVAELDRSIQQHENRIKAGYYEDLFRSIDSMEGVQPQNQLFLSQKNAEKLLQLGPVLERLHGEFLNAVVDRTFAQCVRANLLPPAPPELQGQPLRTRYISSLAMAQREVATTGIDKLTMFIAGLVKSGFTSAADTLDADQAVDEYAKSIGTPPRLLVPADQLAQIRAARQKQAQQEQKMAMAQQAAQATNQMANAPLPNGQNALSVMGSAVAANPGILQGAQGGPPVGAPAK